MQGLNCSHNPIPTSGSSSHQRGPKCFIIDIAVLCVFSHLLQLILLRAEPRTGMERQLLQSLVWCSNLDPEQSKMP